MARAWMKAALAGMAIMAMTAPVHAADTIKIGVPGAHSGDLVSYGMPSLNAARIVADEYNAKGGILGKQIEIIAEDDARHVDGVFRAALGGHRAHEGLVAQRHMGEQHV